VPSAHGATLIDDSYNANPDSVRAAIDVLARAQSPRVLVLGDMGEVGDEGPRVHDEVVAYAAAHGIDHLLGLGEAVSRAIRAAAVSGFEAFEAHEPLIVRAATLAQPGATVLVKGSRFMRMESVVAALAADGAAAGGH
jgi:UDP-N-acetylmuramoyl-tripeptide--D-alanyl-D-alanine ligase